MNENIRNSIEFLKLVTDEFDINNTPYWLDCGTLLGAYRHSSLIENDYDLDIGVLIDNIDYVNIFINKLESTGAIENVDYLHYGKKVNDKILKLIYKLKDDCRWIDIYFFRKNSNYLESCFFSDETTSKVKTNLYQVENLETIKLGDYYFKCPSDVPKFLKIRYGENYMIPQARCEELNKEWWEVDDNVGNQYLD